MGSGLYNGGQTMSMGINFIGDRGSFLIDGALPVFAGIDSGSFSFSGKTDGGDFWYRFVEIPDRGEYFFVAIDCPTGTWVSCLKQRYRAAVDIFPEEKAGFHFYSSSNVTIRYTVFWGLPVIPAASNTYGMRAWNNNGQLIFDSGHTLFSLYGRSRISSDGKYGHPGGARGWAVFDSTGTTREIGAHSGGYQSKWLTGIYFTGSSYTVAKRRYSWTGPWSGISGLADRGPDFNLLNVSVT